MEDLITVKTLLRTAGRAPLAHNGPMECSPGPAAPVSLELARLRRSCCTCAMADICLPLAVDGREVTGLDVVAQQRRGLDRGEAAYRAGDAMSALYVVREGAFKSVAIDDGGGQQVLGFHLPGEVFGLDGIGSDRHACEAVALQPSRLCALPYAGVAEVAAGLPRLQHQLLRVLGEAGDRDRAHIAVMARRQAVERVALFLRDLSRRYQRAGEDGGVFRLPMSREDIGSYLGLALETVSRGFSRLHDDRIIDVYGRRVRILDDAALEAVAQGQEPAAGQPALLHA